MAVLGKFSALRARLGGGGVEIKRAIAAGAAANANIAIAGLSHEAQVLSVVYVNAGVPSDVSADLTKVTAGDIQLSVDTSAGHVDVLYAQPA